MSGRHARRWQAIGGPWRGSRLHRAGFSLVEAVVALAVFAILATLAVTTFRQQQLRSRRIEATVALLNVAVEQERAYTSDQRYRANLAAAPPTGLGLPETTPSGGFRIELRTSAQGDAFEVTATATGAQAADTHCAMLRLDESGRRSASNPDCWGR